MMTFRICTLKKNGEEDEVLNLPMSIISRADDVLVNFEVIKSRDHLEVDDIIGSVIRKDPEDVQEGNGFIIIKYKTVLCGFSRKVLVIITDFNFKKIR